MRRRWTQPSPAGEPIECRLPWWYPLFLNLLGVWSAARGQLPDDAALARQLHRHVRVRRLPDGRWMRWRDLA